MGERNCYFSSTRTRVIALLSASSSSSSSWDDNALLNRRLEELKNSETLQEQLQSGISRLQLPVLCMDAMLPKQRLQLRTSDAVFGRFLRDGIGLGGIFVMTSLSPATRMIRRHGVICKVQALDVVAASSSSSSNADDDESSSSMMIMSPTAVDFEIVGQSRCRVVGPREGMGRRIGRWRRGYDPDGEESVLGWGMERFQKANDELVVFSEDEEGDDGADGDKTDYTEWSTCLVDVNLDRIDEHQDDMLSKDEESSTISKLDTLASMVQEWKELAINVQTFENLNVTATTRIQRGQPGLSVDPKILIKNVEQEMGPSPPASSSPTAFCFWAAALINPLPPLGVSMEIRGAMLEAATVEQRMAILERGLIRSIDNLKGIRPL